MAKLAPIRPAVLEWAIREAALTPEDLAERSGVSLSRVRSFLHPDEALRDAPNTGEFRRLAKALDRPLASLLAPEPPASEARVASFRTPPGRPSDHALLPAEQSALRATSRWQAIVSGLRRDQGMDEVFIPRVARDARPADAASHIAKWLEWDSAAQRAATSPAAVLRMARQALEERGVLTLQFSLGDGACKGFSIPHETAPAVALNSGYNSAARLYSVFHEAAHLVRGDRAVCGAVRNDRVERWCEETAADLLVPHEDLIPYVTSRFPGSRVETVVQCSTIASRYNVSLRAAAVRLRELGMAGSTLWDEVDEMSEGNVRIPNPNSPRQTTPVIRRRELGVAIPTLLINAVENRRLSEFQVRRYLDVNGAQLRELALLVQSGEDS